MRTSPLRKIYIKATTPCPFLPIPTFSAFSLIAISNPTFFFLPSAEFLSSPFLEGKAACLQELANHSPSLEEENSNKRVVRALYEALSARDVDTVQRLLAPDIEWWFHGPPSFQYLMQLLTGGPSEDSFEFVPQTITAFGSTVLVEGHDPNHQISWVHAWTVSDGVITQVREYFNTSLTVTRLDSSDTASTSSSFHCLPSLWKSRLSDLVGKSVPGLVLAI